FLRVYVFAVRPARSFGSVGMTGCATANFVEQETRRERRATVAYRRDPVRGGRRARDDQSRLHAVRTRHLARPLHPLPSPPGRGPGAPQPRRVLGAEPVPARLRRRARHDALLLGPRADVSRRAGGAGPEEDRYLFDRWTEALVQGGAAQPAGAVTALAELYGYFTDLVDRRRHQPGDDLVSTLLAADDEGAGLGIEGILGYAFVLIAG